MRISLVLISRPTSALLTARIVGNVSPHDERIPDNQSGVGTEFHPVLCENQIYWAELDALVVKRYVSANRIREFSYKCRSRCRCFIIINIEFKQLS